MNRLAGQKASWLAFHPGGVGIAVVGREGVAALPRRHVEDPLLFSSGRDHHAGRRRRTELAPGSGCVAQPWPESGANGSSDRLGRRLNQTALPVLRLAGGAADPSGKSDPGHGRSRSRGPRPVGWQLELWGCPDHRALPRQAPKGLQASPPHRVGEGFRSSGCRATTLLQQPARPVPLPRSAASMRFVSASCASFSSFRLNP